MGNFPTIQEFAKQYKIAKDDPDLKRAYDKYVEAQMEYNEHLYWDTLAMQRKAAHEGRRQGLEKGFEQGCKEGRKQGRKEGRKEGFDEAVEALRERLVQLGYDESIVAATEGLVAPAEDEPLA